MHLTNNLSQNEVANILRDKYISKEEATKLGISNAEAKDLTYQLSGGEITEEYLVDSFMLKNEKSDDKMISTILGSFAGLSAGIAVGDYFMSQKFKDLIVKNEKQRQNYNNAIKNSHCMILDKKGKPLNYRYNNFLANLGKNPSASRLKCASAALIVMTAIGGLIGYFSTDKS